MFWLSRPHHLARILTSRLNRGRVWPATARNGRLVRRSTLLLQELEDRVVPTLLGQQLFPSDNPWNQNISNAPVAANSAAIIAHIGASIPIHPDWGADNPANGDDPLYGIPVNIVHGNSTAKVNVIIDNYPGESDIVPVPIPANAVIEGDYQDGPNPEGGGYNSGQRGDSHLIIWDEDTNTAYELFGVTRPSDPTLFPNTDGVELPHTDGLWHAAQETVWNMNTNTFRTLGETSADAAGLSILAGLVRPDEGLPVSQGGQGAIDHALRFTLPSGDVNPQYVYPASHIVSVSQGADKLPFGGRLRLENTPAIDTLINDMPPESQIIARAMQQYGLILADIGSAMYVTGTSATIDDVDSPNIDLTWNLNDIFASNGLKALDAGDFQVVNLTPVVTGLSQSSGSAGSTITITGQNFSGAAGHLSVFFGSTAASSVTDLSDSQITAIVPNGVGTVNVTVQSGVNETDNLSGNPNANVNAPIFGYGISTVTTADQFTYSSQTISPTNSKVSFASSTVASGDTDLLTLLVEDAAANAISGLASWRLQLCARRRKKRGHVRQRLSHNDAGNLHGCLHRNQGGHGQHTHRQGERCHAQHQANRARGRGWAQSSQVLDQIRKANRCLGPNRRGHDHLEGRWRPSHHRPGQWRLQSCSRRRNQRGHVRQRLRHEEAGDIQGCLHRNPGGHGQHTHRRGERRLTQQEAKGARGRPWDQSSEVRDQFRIADRCFGPYRRAHHRREGQQRQPDHEPAQQRLQVCSRRWKSAGKFRRVSATTTPGTYTGVFTVTTASKAGTLTPKMRGTTPTTAETPTPYSPANHTL